jgi:mannose-6-phosphate isomerase
VPFLFDSYKSQSLECTAQSYAWGKIGSSSLVGCIKDVQLLDFTINEEKPYAELWIGTHPNGMSNIILPPLNGGTQPCKKSLLDYVQSNPNIHLGLEDMNKSSKEYDLTFLFKVLCIEKCFLSKLTQINTLLHSYI